MKNDEPVGFYVKELDAGCYSVRLNLAYLVYIPQLVRTFQSWMSTRSDKDKLFIYLENGATDSIWSEGSPLLRNVADLVTSIQLSPAYENTTLVVSQMLCGAASYLILSTPRVKWGPLGFVSFDGWLSGKNVEDYDQGQRSDVKWVRDLFRKGVDLKLFTEQDVKDHEDGVGVTLGTGK